MSEKTDAVKTRIQEIESLMQIGDFWDDKVRAQELVKELKLLKSQADGGNPYDAGGAHMTLFAGAGGDDAEEFAAMLFNMYLKYITGKGWSARVLHENENTHGGFRNVTIEVAGKSVYGTLKGESGVHRLVRISPYDTNKRRHTSFALVEVIPKFEKTGELEIRDDEIKVDFARSSGPGGQNVNKRETAVRIVHIATKIAVHVDSERSQHANREKALEILRGKLYKLREEERVAKEKGMYISKTTDIEWGNQIRSYVLHPYKMVKDHRTGVETSQVAKVLDGEIGEFIEAEKKLS